MNLFETRDNISYEVFKIKNDSIFSKVFDILCSNDYLIAYDVDNNFLFSITDLKKGLMISKFGKIGQGPYEISGFPTSFSINGQGRVSFFDPNKNTLYVVNLSNPSIPTLQKSEFIKDSEEMIMTLSPLSSNLLIATGTFTNGRYLLMDTIGRKISYNFDYPKFLNDTKFTNAHKAMAFQGKLIVRPDGKSFFFACEDSEVFEIIKIKENDEFGFVVLFIIKTGVCL